jgi:RNA polymerase primary sigma factor
MKTNLRIPSSLTATTVVQSRHPVTVVHWTQARRAGKAPAADARSAQTAPSTPQPGERPREAVNGHDADIVFRLYAREIGQVQLLSQQEEIALARRIRRGDDDAREQMIKANLRLVVKIAHDFEGQGMPLLDLISEGNIGLMKAVERFDPYRGAKLSTYASFYIKQAMRRAIADQGRLIRLPVYAQEKLIEINRADSKLRELLGRPPSDDEISSEMGLPPAKVRRLRDAAIPPTSLDEPQDDDPTNPFSEMVADVGSAAPDAALDHADTTELVRQLLDGLPPRELAILRRRFGFEAEGERTLEEIGAEMGLTRERIRQLQNSALRRLRNRLRAFDTERLAA